MKVLLTGFSGLLGTAVCKELLVRGNSVRALMHGAAIDRRDLDRRIDIIWGDLADLEKFDRFCQGVDAVIHCAWDPYAGNGESVAQRNTEATCGLAKAANRAGVRVFVHISSIAVYGLSRDLYGKELDETQPLAADHNTLNTYLCGKIEIEKQLSAMREEMDTNVVIVRPGLLFSDTKAPTRKYIPGSRIGLGVVLGSGRNHLPYVHVADVANLVVTLIEQSPPDAVYNAVAASRLGAARFLKNWGRASGRRIVVVRLPPAMLRALTWAVQLLKRALGRQEAEADVSYQIQSGTRHIFYSSAQADRELGWRAVSTLAVASGRAGAAQ